jgi:hypothetical protein
MFENHAAVGWTLAAVFFVAFSIAVAYIATRERLFGFLYSTSKDWGQAFKDVTRCLNDLRKCVDEDRSLDRELKQEIKDDIKETIASSERAILAKIELLVEVSRRSGGDTNFYNTNADGGQTNQGGSVKGEQR